MGLDVSVTAMVAAEDKASSCGERAVNSCDATAKPAQSTPLQVCTELGPGETETAQSAASSPGGRAVESSDATDSSAQSTVLQVCTETLHGELIVAPGFLLSNSYKMFNVACLFVVL